MNALRCSYTRQQAETNKHKHAALCSCNHAMFLPLNRIVWPLSIYCYSARTRAHVLALNRMTARHHDIRRASRCAMQPQPRHRALRGPRPGFARPSYRGAMHRRQPLRLRCRAATPTATATAAGARSGEVRAHEDRARTDEHDKEVRAGGRAHGDVGREQ